MMINLIGETIDTVNAVWKVGHLRLQQGTDIIVMEQKQLEKLVISFFNPLCPKCGDLLIEDDRRWECVNEACENCRS